MDELIGDMLRAGYVPAGYDELRRMLRAAANGEDRKVPNRKDRRAFERAGPYGWAPSRRCGRG